MTDIIDRIDAAIGCQECGGGLDRSVSDDFCFEDCQFAWYQGRVEPFHEELEFLPIQWTGVDELREQTSLRFDDRRRRVRSDLEDSLRYAWSALCGEPGDWSSPVVEAPVIMTHEGYRSATCFTCGYREFSNSIGAMDYHLHYCFRFGQPSHMVKWVRW